MLCNCVSSGYLGVVIVRGGVTVAKYYYDLPVLHTFIGTDIKSLSIIDRDFKTDEIKQELERESTSQGVRLHILRKAEIESYLLKLPLLTRVASERSLERGGPKIESTELESMLKQAMDETIVKTTDHIAQEIINWSRRQGTGLDFPTGAEMARSYVKQHWGTIDDCLTVCQGKEILSKINSYLQSKYSISLSLPALLNAMDINDIDDELKELMNEIVSL